MQQFMPGLHCVVHGYLFLVNHSTRCSPVMSIVFSILVPCQFVVPLSCCTSAQTMVAALHRLLVHMRRKIHAYEDRVAEVAKFNEENVWRKRGISITPIR